MKWDSNTLTVVCVVIGTLGTIFGAVRSFIKTGREQKQKIDGEKQSAKQEGYNKGQEDARALLNPEMQLLQSRLEDAKRDRDIQQERADRLEADLRQVWSNRRGGGGQ